ncbi:MAG: aldehyde dehydrogenase family protein [Verrucomicrobiota bacterium]|jgi:acyl-CoA reductase-like NAD-dependent aldehyde dehydrogenase|nr:aldehyde dehydrogenase family protein [Verrucomicrobiota bacterium]
MVLETECMENVSAPTKTFLGREGKLLIDGKWVTSANGETFETINPATKQPICCVARGNGEDIDRAVASARRSFESGVWWRKTTPAERGRVIHRIGELIDKNGDELAELETLDNGKAVSISRAVDIPLSAEHFRYYAGWATKIEGETIPVNGPYFNYTLREPMGVVGQIIPWNFPLLMAAWKLGPALATGNSIVLKPAEQTPLTAIRLAELVQEAGVPDGVLNVVTGYGDAGAALANHPDVDKVAFTGSTEVGHEIVKASAGNLKRVSLELGGKSPNIIFPDAQVEQAIEGAAMAIFFNHGQCCCAGSRLFIDHQIYDQVVEGITEIAKKIRVGSGLDPNTDMGPLISEEQFDRVTGYLQKGLDSGAKIRCGGSPSKEGDLAAGYFVQPTVFADIKDEMEIVREEIFGPVVAVTPFEDMEEVAQRANDTTYGLAAGIWTQDITKAHKLASLLKAGTVWINCYNAFDAASPFGGYKQSGYGREMGHHVLELYTQVKSVWVGLT